MKNNKFFILLPDGVGLRNFAYSGFYRKAVEHGLNPVYWNQTLFDLSSLDFPEIKINQQKFHPLTDIYKKAKVQVELNLNIQRSGEPVYNGYRFPFSYKSIGQIVKNLGVHWLTATHSSEQGWQRIRRKIKQQERKSTNYQLCLQTLKVEQPAMVFCTNQRHIISVAPILAAQDLGIPTACFIYSWDNLPKATLVVETDYYLVWSEYMKRELLYYYPYIQPDQIIVTGSPQFEMHFHPGKWQQRADFCAEFGLDPNKKYICFSGNDVTSSPDDPKYLEDIAKAVVALNEQGQNIGLIFRRCPVDFSSRFDAVIDQYKDVITAINPLWKPLSSAWNTILPTPEDDSLLSAVAEHADFLITIGSSTIFDFIAHQKPCGYLKYNQPMTSDPRWDIHTCYQFVHFRSMPSSDSVMWINSPQQISEIILEGLSQPKSTLQAAQKWFEIINQAPAFEASKRIISGLSHIMEQENHPTKEASAQ